MSRQPWDLTFTADPEEVGALRRLMRLHLGFWGLHEVVDEAQLCVSELVSNVITHVGHGTPATLAVSMSGTHLRIEVHDPDTRALPTLMAADSDSESGRGMALVDAVADCWGVQFRSGRKVTWCELGTGIMPPTGQGGGSGVSRAEKLLDVYATTKSPPVSTIDSRLSTTMAEEAVIGVITDFLHWLRAHGKDPDEVLDHAQTRFESQIRETAATPCSPRNRPAKRRS
ncbi:ATP-binding protein [Streptomyces europaeiscabiei]|uniref:ATP-binding protein n=1 Tax=Streptomyces TaxID=1883 RepID=UPI000A3A1C21|nr:MULTISPECIES: ATP-binding protein [Streptomyces]MDX3629675.1 ATP-binding protein [Streptomyces europaeiscabiei]MDX3648292.1 ATP-binding protein [Streptomyces europaeiscabiei]MDX3694157.1 ATP-binding protein [Streptomyces europaeiscabiei]WUD32986.1 ATP-binding protein [Streptomyces europaeiscabiei]